MNRKLIHTVVLLLAAIAVIVVLYRIKSIEEGDGASSLQNTRQSRNQAPAGETIPAGSTPSLPDSNVVDAKHTEEVREGLESIMEGLKQMGAGELPPIANLLKEAAASGDSGAMRRAFHEATYGRFAKMSESIPAMKAHLDSSDPFVRYLAAEALLRVGDKSGVDALVSIVQSDAPVAQGDKDLRIAAATTLAMFNVCAAAETIRNLYSKNREGELLKSLSALGIQAHEAEKWNYVPSAPAIENYAKEGSTRFIAQIRDTFEQAGDLATKNAAAWSLARMTGAEQYVEHLIKTTGSAVEAHSDKRGFNESTEALRYLGSIQTPAAVDTLEKALLSKNPIAVQYAAVNLLFNQPGGSHKAEQFIIKEFETSPRMLGIDLAMRIASKSGNPEVRSAAQSYAQRTGSDAWRYWGVERADWPVQNWIFDYVVTLNP